MWKYEDKDFNVYFLNFNYKYYTFNKYIDLIKNLSIDKIEFYNFSRYNYM